MTHVLNSSAEEISTIFLRNLDKLLAKKSVLDACQSLQVRASTLFQMRHKTPISISFNCPYGSKYCWFRHMSVESYTTYRPFSHSILLTATKARSVIELKVEGDLN